MESYKLILKRILDNHPTPTEVLTVVEYIELSERAAEEYAAQNQDGHKIMGFVIEHSFPTSDKKYRSLDIPAFTNALVTGTHKKYYPDGTGNEELKYGDKVKCSMHKDFNGFWIGTYIAKHPEVNAHIVLTRDCPELKVSQELDAYAFCQKFDW